MDLIHIIALALVQGLTEFLPISSEAHLILVPVVTHWLHGSRRGQTVRSR